MSRVRSVIIVINNYDDDEIVKIEKLMSTCKYGIYALEVGAEGTPHIQAYVQFKNAKSFNSIKKQLPRAHIEKAKGTPIENRIYCTKSGKYKEFGEKPKEGGEMEKERWEKALKNARSGNIEEIPADIFLRCRNSIMKEKERCQIKPDALEETRNLWIYGPTGTGKSHYVHNNFDYETVYLKSNNKWFDGFDSSKHKIVYLEDFSIKDAEYLGDKLKRWADKWPFTAEIKGGSICIRPERVIVTSNYSIHDLFFEEEMRGPLARRFKQICKKHKNQSI